MMGREMVNGAVMAVEEVNQSEEFDFTFTPHLRDPGGVVFAYHSACEELIREDQASTISSAVTPPPRASRCFRSSSAPIVCSGIPLDTRASKAATT